MEDQRSAVMENEWLRVGAEIRLGELLKEVEAIFVKFPELRQRHKPPMTGSVSGKREFSKKGKQAISEGMRKYWARRKASESKSSKAASRS